MLIHENDRYIKLKNSFAWFFLFDFYINKKKQMNILNSLNIALYICRNNII